MDKKKLKKNIKKGLTYAGLFLGVFAVSATTAYLVTPSSASGADDSIIDEDDDDSSTVKGGTNGDRFLSALATTKGLKGELTAKIAMEKNAISLTGNLGLAMPRTDEGEADSVSSNIAFSLDANVNYNEVEKSFSASLVDKTMYFSALGLKYKCDEDGIGTAVDHIFDIAGEDFFNIPNLDLSSLTGNLDMSSLSSMFGGITSEETANGYDYVISITPDANTTYKINMSSDKSYNLTNANVKDLTIGGVTINFNFDATIADDMSKVIVAPSDSASYCSLVNSMGIFDKLYSLIDEKKFGVSLSGSLVTEPAIAGDPVDTIALDGDVKADFNAMNFSASIDANALNSSNERVHQKLGVNYVPTMSGYTEAAFLSYNDAFKLSMKRTTIDSLFGKIKGSVGEMDSSKVSSLFDFVTSSTVMTGIKDGHYESILKMVDGFTESDNELTLTISLKDLGLGDSAKLVVTLNGENPSEGIKDGAKIAINDVQLSKSTVNLALNIENFSEITMPVVADYDSLDRLPDLFDQVSGLVKDPKAGVSLSGSVYDANQIGFSFDGDTTFDIENKKGAGDITITDKTVSYTQDHEVKIDVTGGAAADNMYFSYDSTLTDSSAPMYGRFTITTLNEIISLVKDLMGSSDERYTKFFDPLKEMMATSLIGQIASGEYSKLITTNILTYVNVGSDKTDLLIAGSALGLDSDISISLLTKEDGTISGLSLNDLVTGGKTINVQLTLTSFAESGLTRLDHSLTYLDFSEIKTLLKFGLDTSELGTFHLTSVLDLAIGDAFNLTNINIEIYINVSGRDVKVYGKMSNIPLMAGLNTTSLLAILGGKRDVNFYYDGVGKSDLYLNEHNDYVGSRYDKTAVKKIQGDYFLSNIVDYLLKDFIGLTDTMMDLVGNISSSDTSEPIAYEKVLKNFAYDSANKAWDVSISTSTLARMSALGDLTLHIAGTHDWSTGKDYLNYLEAKISITMVLTINAGIKANLIDVNTPNLWNNIDSAYTSFISTNSSLAGEGYTA